jgi:hypothetical protein
MKQIVSHLQLPWRKAAAPLSVADVGTIVSQQAEDEADGAVPRLQLRSDYLTGRHLALGRPAAGSAFFGLRGIARPAHGGGG